MQTLINYTHCESNEDYHTIFIERKKKRKMPWKYSDLFAKVHSLQNSFPVQSDWWSRGSKKHCAESLTRLRSRVSQTRIPGLNFQRVFRPKQLFFHITFACIHISLALRWFPGTPLPRCRHRCFAQSLAKASYGSKKPSPPPPNPVLH